jgi:RNA polymerase sigma-70 factor (sigma-E family)
LPICRRSDISVTSDLRACVRRIAVTLGSRLCCRGAGYGWGVNVGGDHGLTGTHASAAGMAPRVADSVTHESVQHGIGRGVRTVSLPDSGNGDAGHRVIAPAAPTEWQHDHTPEQEGDDDPSASRQELGAVELRAVAERSLVPSARSVHHDELTDRAAADDPVFRDYVRSRSRALLRTAYLLTGNVADAEDLVQVALTKTYVAWDRIQDRSALDGYVRRAIVNTHISWWRRRRVEEYPTDEVPDQAVVDNPDRSDLQESLRRAIDRLPRRMRAAVMLRYYDDMTEAEVAEVLGVSLGTVKSTVSRAVAKLRIDAELQPELADSPAEPPADTLGNLPLPWP